MLLRKYVIIIYGLATLEIQVCTNYIDNSLLVHFNVNIMKCNKKRISQLRKDHLSVRIIQQGLIKCTL